MSSRARAITLALVVATTGCATGHAVSTVPDSVTIHTLRRQYSNTHVVAKGRTFFLVDAGYEADGPALAEELRRAGFDPAAAKAIILSHGHPDHAGGASYFHKTFGTRVVAGAADASLFSAGAGGALCPTGDRARKQQAGHEAARYTPFAPDVAVTEETALEPIVGIPGRIVPMPGHTPGSLVVVLPASRAVLVGDLFRGAIVGSSADVHFYMCDLDANRRDIVRLVDTIAPDATTFFTGHFGPVSREAVLATFGGGRP